jgi:hypothetical protein
MYSYSDQALSLPSRERCTTAWEAIWSARRKRSGRRQDLRARMFGERCDGDVGDLHVGPRISRLNFAISPNVGSLVQIMT